MVNKSFLEIMNSVNTNEPPSDKTKVRTAKKLEKVNFDAPDSLLAFYSKINGWSGFLNEQYISFYSLDEAIENTIEVDSNKFGIKLLAIGDNGASEILFISESNIIYIGEGLTFLIL